MTTAQNERELLDSVPGKLYIDGEWVDGEDGTIEVRDPATGDVIHTIANGSVADGKRALDAACAVQDEWARTSARERSDILRRAFDMMMERKEEFALLMTMEMGKPLSEARGEVDYGAGFLRWYAEEAVRVYGRYHDNPESTGRMIVSYRPVGPTYLITPWNFPLAMATRKIGPALAAGCTMVVKPATLTPLTTLKFVQLLEEAGLPKGVVNVITTRSTGALTDEIMSDDRLRKVSFTGSTPVGVGLMKKAADKVLRSSMELGGNAPFVIFEDADLDLAVDGALKAKFRNIGEACTAANRFIVHESVADEFVKRVTEKVAELKMGRGTEEGVVIGPLVEPKAVDNIERLVEEAVASGATVTTGGKRVDGPGSFFEATVIDGISPEMTVSVEEIFGPVLAVQRFTTEEEAIALANATEYGLMAYVYTEDAARQHRLIDLIDTGMMGVNQALLSNAAAPFGGVKQSGIGREGGPEGILEYLSMKYTLIPNPHA